MAALLELIGVRRHFGAVAAVAGVDLRVDEGVLHTIIGPNGAGKTTLFNCITGELEPSAGRIVFDGRDITGAPPHRLPALGIARSFQRTSVFSSLTVAQNVWTAIYGTGAGRGWGAALGAADGDPALRDMIGEALAQVGLERRADQPAEELSHGDQRLLDFAIALGSRPRLLLLDEPTAGLSRGDTQLMITLIERLKRRYTIVLIEHKMDVVMRVSDRISVMNFGSVLAEGAPEEIRADPIVREAYLGKRS
jgi:branched-chain amino acid transport system ATP-binding protein